ncbi:MAG: phage gp6-like head-tail connector protein [Chloroflexi bacterium]|nr:MAG: phage gp6-like head-tail connector protein [Chloroflexota bacterium]
MSIAYATLDELKDYLGIQSNDDDALLQGLLLDVSRQIDHYCDRWFYGSVHTRYYDYSPAHIDGNKLYLDADIVGVDYVVNGNGGTIPANAYVVDPANTTPKHTIRLKRSSGTYWTYENDVEQAIVVAGTFGYVAGTTPPEPIKRATLRLAQQKYAQRDAPFEVRGLSTDQFVDVPSATLADVQQLLAPYRKVNFYTYRW